MQIYIYLSDRPSQHYLKWPTDFAIKYFIRNVSSVSFIQHLYSNDNLITITFLWLVFRKVILSMQAFSSEWSTKSCYLRWLLPYPDFHFRPISARWERFFYWEDGYWQYPYLVQRINGDKLTDNCLLTTLINVAILKHWALTINKTFQKYRLLHSTFFPVI